MEAVICHNYDSRWDEFVQAHPAGTFFHQWRWREVISSQFGYEPSYLLVEDSGCIQGVLPLFLVRSLLFGRSLVAMPLAVYGGVVAQNAAAEALLIEKALGIAIDRQAKYLELRGNPYRQEVMTQITADSAGPIKQKDLYVTFMGEIDPSDEVNLNRIPRKQRRMVRQGEKNGLKVAIDNQRLREFYQVYAASVRNLGTPVYGYPYFERLVESFGEACKVFLVEYGQMIVAAVMVFFYKDQVMPYYGGALKEYFNLAPNDFMYWEVMRHGASQGYKVFDFGRSKEGTGAFNFKRHWGFEPRPLPYLYYPIRTQEIPDTSPLNPKLQWAIRIWRNLPLKLTMALGPRIVRHIP
ncbi:MAG: FemAB family XrtA/PEP-CTERM system-associated protein [Alphaproteobacteria bacterium]